MADKRIVCLGGGIGTVNLISGLKAYFKDITVVVSMADDGGSAGRLRRLYSIPPPGDLVSCIAALSNVDPLMKQLLTYRFSGDRYGSDGSLPGHKFGNLMLVALSAITGDFNKAILEMQRIFKTSGKILPSTVESISIWAKTSVGEKVYREENIDLGKFTGTIDKLFLKPVNPRSPDDVKKAIENADVVIAGPGDLYTTILPVLLVSDVIESLKKSKAKKIFVVNVANKTFETPNYKISDYVSAIVKHCGSSVFETFLVNNNFKSPIPAKYKYQYEFVPLDHPQKKNGFEVIQGDFVNEEFPLYHSQGKLAKMILGTI